MTMELTAVPARTHLDPIQRLGRESAYLLLSIIHI
jgi:hypothetical protein